MAIEQLCELHDSGDYDLIVVDTPPTRHALDFLEAPQRLADFLDRQRRSSGSCEPYFSAGWSTLRAVNRTAGFLLRRLEEATGVSALVEISDFFTSMSGLFDDFEARVAARRTSCCAGRETAFVLVSSAGGAGARARPSTSRRKMAELRMPLRGVVFNRVHHEFRPRAAAGRGGARSARRTSTRSRRVVARALGGRASDARELAANFVDYQVLARGESLRIEQFRAGLPRRVPVVAGAELRARRARPRRAGGDARASLRRHPRRGMTARADLLRVAPDDPEYRRLATAEAAYWSGPVPFALESLEERFSEGPVDRYTNLRFTGDRSVGWHETIARHGPFRRGLVLGLSALRLEGRDPRDEPGPAPHLHGPERGIARAPGRHPGGALPRARRHALRGPELRGARARRVRRDRVVVVAAPRHQPRAPGLADQCRAGAGRLVLPERLCRRAALPVRECEATGIRGRCTIARWRGRPDAARAAAGWTRAI